MGKLSKRSAGKERESILFVGAIIAFVLVVNIVLAYFSSAFGWYFLATDRKFYTLSGVTDEYFDKVNPDPDGEGPMTPEKVTLYFCMSEEGLKENPTFERILHTAKQFGHRYDFLTVKHVRPEYDHELLEAFTHVKDKDGNDRLGADGEPLRNEISDMSVIAYSEDTKRYEVAALSDFYYFDTEDTTNDDMIFVGEELVAALVGRVVANDRPVAYFTVGHGELATRPMADALTRAGFDWDTLDLSKGAVPKDVQLLVIAAPQYDFEEYDDKTIECEINRLRDFVKGGGTILFFRSTSAGKLPCLDRFLSEFGITAEEGMITDGSSSAGFDEKSVLLRYDGGEGARPVRSYARKYDGSSAIQSTELLVAGAAPLTLSSVTGATAVPLLRTHGSAVNRVDGKKVSEAGSDGYITAALSRLDGEGGHVAVISADAFAGLDTMESEGYGNKEFLYALLTETVGASTPIGCGIVLLNTYPLEGVTRSTANVFLAVFAGALPLCVAGVGVIVLRRRRLR